MKSVHISLVCSAGVSELRSKASAFNPRNSISQLIERKEHWGGINWNRGLLFSISGPALCSSTSESQLAQLWSVKIGLEKLA